MSVPGPREDAPHVLDNPARASLTGPHARFAERRGRILRYPVDVSPWLALPDDIGADDWADLAALSGPGTEVGLPGYRGDVPDGWELTMNIPGVQLVDDGMDVAPEPQAVRLGPADGPEIPPGWTEISAVCTDPAHRGEGLATRLIRAVGHGIRARGEIPFLHTGAGNTGAIRLYESLGFRLRRRTAFLAARVPQPLGQSSPVPADVPAL
jgi:ribosomal protein S18 acetylase RimI-like enzyme